LLLNTESTDAHMANHPLKTSIQSVPDQLSVTTELYAKHAKPVAAHELSGHSDGSDSQSSPRKPAECAAVNVLNGTGVPILRLDCTFVIGVWSDADGAEIREALRILKLDSLPIRYLDGAGIPVRYKVRRLNGELIPLSV